MNNPAPRLTRTLERPAYALKLAAVLTACLLLLAVCSVSRTARVHADDGDDNQDAYKAKIGLAIAPVPLNLQGKDRTLVGLGSYIVNSQGDCNGCHSPSAAVEYAPGGNPYFNQKPIIVNAAVYLGGGQDFGELIPGSADIVSRNLTPDKTGMAEGGHTFDQFRQIIRTGIDFDHLHPTCIGAPNANCVPPPFDGNLLQIMPWPTYSNMTDHDLLAIYEYLSAIPCIAGPPAPSVLHNDC